MPGTKDIKWAAQYALNNLRFLHTRQKVCDNVRDKKHYGSQSIPTFKK